MHESMNIKFIKIYLVDILVNTLSFFDSAQVLALIFICCRHKSFEK